ncbi:citrate lyase subunit beta/citryl-CoA lyase [Altererythrobacter atlanticus]|uniref:Citrate lyase subunit beta-like protein n=1 Tax=Croceibacterium atlanticum TaxID=1267766 RepID=A0A0F7KPW4_9SPHN|nr:CoA ester lyase [Croceibacterium atlanticum]AKH42573.1 Citrate lyase subunit beta-like protein [Croceibacterium atlanticum]MBB5731350.1 citrate lyase subunit beta/citryl-CoA lyase [Croceibacterium atlanticum]
MAMRSWLFVPGDSEKKLSKVAGCGADVVIVDLEDAVSPQSKAVARQMTHDWLRTHQQQLLAGGGHGRWVRINALGTQLWRDDLAAVMPARPDGIMVPKAAGPDQLRLLAAELLQHEQRNGIQPGTTRILPLVSETPAAALGIPAYADAQQPRLAGLTWGAEDLSAAIGASRKRDSQGEWTDAFRMVRANVLLAAHAAGVLAVDTLHADFRDSEGLKRIAANSYADGFNGMMAIHPDQVPIINAAYTPGEEDIARARAIVNAFSANPGAGALQLDGRMIDQPHLEQARKLLENLR